MWTIKVKKTFSFTKLANEWGNVMSGTKSNIRNHAINSFRLNIDRQSSPVDGKFQSLKPHTKKRRLRAPFTHTPPKTNILKDTGNLYNSFRPVGDDRISAAGYGLKHIYGTRQMPIRDWADVKFLLPKKTRELIIKRIAKAWRSK